MLAVFRRAQQIFSFGYTIYLFTKSDTPLVIFPMVRLLQDII